jgi:NADPH2:quinone reductase
MRALRIRRYGGPEVLERVELPVPEPGPGEALVHVACAGINFMDVHTRQGKYDRSRTYPVRLPCTLGMEGAGLVVAAGEGATRVAPGDRVAWCLSWGSYADYAVVPEAKLARLPPAIGYDLAAASLFQGSTAHYLAHDVGRLAPGVTCLVHAASGSIGRLLVQMARQRGARVIATASTPEKRAVALAAGAHHAVPYDDGGFAEAVRELTDGRGADVVFDAIGRATLRASFRAARVRGLVVNYGSVSGAVTDLDPIELGESGSLYLTRPRLADHLADAATVQRRADELFAALASGELRVQIEERCGWDGIEAAHARLEARRQVGKAILVLPGGPAS